jgi:hypothetical protein
MTEIRELIAEVRGLRQDLRESETRIALIQLAESQIDRALGQHIGHVKKRLEMIYAEAKKSGDSAITSAVESSPWPMLPEQKK